MRIKIIIILLLQLSIIKISAQNSYSLDIYTKTAPTEKMTMNETEIGFTVSKKINSKNTITNSIRYLKTGVNYDLGIQDLQDNFNDFTSIANNLTIDHEVNDKTSFTLDLKSNINFEKNMGIDDVLLLGGLKINYKFNESNSISAGVKRNMFFGKLNVSPTFSYNRQINEKTVAVIGFPSSLVSYSNNSRNKFSLKNDFEGAIYNLDYRGSNDKYNSATRMTYSKMATTFEYIRSLDSYWSINLKGGYGFNNKYNLTDNAANITYDFKNNNGYIFNVGIKFNH